MKEPNFTFCRGRENKQPVSRPFSFPELRYSPLEFNSRNIHSEQDGISAIKFEAAQIYFLGDVFVAVVVVGGER